MERKREEKRRKNRKKQKNRKTEKNRKYITTNTCVVAISAMQHRMH